jgi:hypothetical protein
VVNTAGYPDAGGRHTNANMKGIGRFFGHGHPCGGLHLHHYKQQFFLNKKFLSSQAREGCAMVYHNNFGSIFFKSGSAKISSDPSINFIRPINQFRQTHQSISSDPSIPLEPSISSRPCSKFCKPIQKKKFYFLSNNFFDSPLSIFESVQRISILGSA